MCLYSNGTRKNMFQGLTFLSHLFRLKKVHRVLINTKISRFECKSFWLSKCKRVKNEKNELEPRLGSDFSRVGVGIKRKEQPLRLLFIHFEIEAI